MSPTILVDTNVLVDVLQNDPVWSDWSAAQLRSLSRVHRLALNPVIYAELALSYDSVEVLDEVIETSELDFEEVPRSALFLASRAHLQYRRRGGHRPQVLPDFFIGAHAAVNGWPLLSRDAARFKTYFPTLRVIAPNS
jgi:predicted nucleic acid-binding protein